MFPKSFNLHRAVLGAVFALVAGCAYGATTTPAAFTLTVHQAAAASEQISPFQPPAKAAVAAEPIWPMPPPPSAVASAEPIWPMPPPPSAVASAEPIWPMPLGIS